MKRALRVVVLLILLGVLVIPGPAPANAAGKTTWTSVVAYFNPNPQPDPLPPDYTQPVLNVLFLQQGSTARRELLNDIEIKPYQSGTLLVGNVLRDPNFTGGAVISATVPVLAVYKQVSTETKEPYSPILYTSFALSDAGLGTFYLPNVQANQAYDTRIGVQNVESLQIEVVLRFYSEEQGEFVTARKPLYNQRTLVINTSDALKEAYNGAMEQPTLPFRGSLVVQAFRAGNDDPARLVVVAQEIQGGGRRAYAFEGVNGGDSWVFMPNAMCEMGDNKMSAEMMVQNVGADNATVWVDYYSAAGDVVATSPAVVIAPRYNHLFDACDEAVYAQTRGQGLSAVIHSDGEPIAALGKVRSDDGLMTAYTGLRMPGSALPGQPYRTVLPYVEWSPKSTGLRTYLTIMNVSNQPATDVRVLYYGSGGVLESSHWVARSDAQPGPLAPYARRTSNPGAARALNPDTNHFAGGVIVESDQPVVVVARVQRTVGTGSYNTLGDDYNGIPYAEILEY